VASRCRFRPFFPFFPLNAKIDNGLSLELILKTRPSSVLPPLLLPLFCSEWKNTGSGENTKSGDGTSGFLPFSLFFLSLSLADKFTKNKSAPVHCHRPIFFSLPPFFFPFPPPPILPSPPPPDVALIEDKFKPTIGKRGAQVSLFLPFLPSPFFPPSFPFFLND